MKQVVLVQHAVGEISVDNFAVVDMELPELQDGEYLVKNIYCGTDPYMRISMNPGEVFPNYPMVTLNEGIPGESVGEVIESKNVDFPVGTHMWHKKGWRTHAIGNSDTEHFVIPANIDLKKYLTFYSLVGRTAYYSLTKVLNVSKGQILGVSGATGGVGNMVVQFANLMGVKAYGLTSTQEKADLITQLGGTGVVVPRKTSVLEIKKIIQEQCEPFDAYHENVGNNYFFGALQNMSYSGIMSYCGVMSLYQDLAPGGGPNLFALTVKDVTIRGCNMTKDLVYGSEEWKEQFSWTDEFHKFINHNIDKLQCINSIYDGIESMPQQFVDHFTPKTPCSGKSLCRI